MPRKQPTPAPMSCARCPLRRQPIFRPFEPQELKFVEWFKSSELHVPKGGNLLLEGATSQHLFTILEGWAFRYKSLPDGRRQILSYALPGDFLGMQGPVLKEMQHSVEALTPLRLCVFPRQRIWALYEKHPELAHDLMWLAMRGERQADEHLLTVGRRSAGERIAFLLLHLFDRLKALGLTRRERMEAPFSQSHVADTIGLSLVHTHRSVRRLLSRKLLRWSREEIEFLDRDQLVQLANYDGDPQTVRPII